MFDAGLKFQCWQVRGRKETVPQQWLKAVKEIRGEAPWNIMFEGISDTAIISKFTAMVSEKTGAENKAAATTGGGEDGSENLGEDEMKLVRGVSDRTTS